MGNEADTTPGHRHPVDEGPLVSQGGVTFCWRETVLTVEAADDVQIVWMYVDHNINIITTIINIIIIKL